MAQVVVSDGFCEDSGIYKCYLFAAWYSCDGDQGTKSPTEPKEVTKESPSPKKIKETIAMVKDQLQQPSKV